VTSGATNVTTDTSGGSGSDPSGGPQSTTVSDASSSSGWDPEPTSLTDTGGVPDDLGEQCQSNADCDSGMCFLAGILGGICSECLTDADCEWGCGLPNPLAKPPEWAACTDGGLGGGCMSDAACVGTLQCALVPGVLSVSTCSECETDGDCSGSYLCSPNIDVATLGGNLECVAPGSRSLGSFCQVGGSGDEACGSGHCGVADVMGLLEFGVCSECSNVDFPDEGCSLGQTCTDPEVNLDGTVTPGECV
jgi:hypothetical protein